MSEYLTVSEFSKKVGISRQAVYKQVDKSLQKYVKRVDKKILINDEAIQYFQWKKDVNQVDMDCKQIDNQVDSKNELIEILKKELEEKNRQLEEKDNQIRMFQKLLDQEQQLRLINNTETKLIEESSEETETQLTFFSKIKKYFAR